MTKCRVGERAYTWLQGCSENTREPGSVLPLKVLRSQEAATWAGKQCFHGGHSIHGDDKVIPTGTCEWVAVINEEHKGTCSEGSPSVCGEIPK